MRYILLLSTGLLLAGCFKTAHGITCPELITYTPEQQQKAAEELSREGISVTKQMIADYLKTRDAIRVCHEWQESYR